MGDRVFLRRIERERAEVARRDFYPAELKPCIPSPNCLVFSSMKRLIIGSVLCSLLGTGCAEKEPFNASLPPQDLYAQCETLQNKKKHDNAVNCFETLKSRYPGTAEAALANLKIGDVHFQKKEYLVAAETYRSFIKLYPAHSRLDYAYYRAGLSYLKESPKAIDRNQEYLDDAIRYFEIILKYYPQSKFYPINKEQWEEARRRVASRAYYVGRFYYRGGEYLAAIPRFTEVYQEAVPLFDVYPEHMNDPSIREYQVQAGTILCDFYNSPWHKKISQDKVFLAAREE